MDVPQKILVAVDDSAASTRAMTYVATLFEGHKGFAVRFLHVLPPVPPGLLEFGGSEDPKREEQLEAELRADEARWLEAAQQMAQPVFARAREIFHRAHVPEGMIETQCSPSNSGKDVVEDIIQAAREHKCHTIVVGREAFTGLQRFFTPHVADALVRRGHGITVWVVE